MHRSPRMNLSKHMRFLALAVFCTILAPLALMAQSSNGSISGNITDGTGAAIPGVTVTATNTATGINRTAVSTNTGHYDIPNLPPGNYRLATELPGFQPLKYERIVVNVGSDTGLNLKLKAGVSETVTVTAAAPLVETTKSEVSSVVNEKSIQNLPANGRNFIDFVLTTPGVVRDVRGGDISFAGQRGTLNSLVVDGVNNVVTKSGTNDSHGSLFDYYRDKKLNANDYINVINGRAKSPYHYDQYGASVGGPIVRDKHFFFANWDVQRNNLPTPVILGSGRITFPTDAATQAGLAKLALIDGSYSRAQNQNAYLLKTDHELAANQHLSFRYNKQVFHGLNFENGGTTSALQHTGNSNVFTDSLAAVYDQTITNSVFNEVRAQYLKDSEPGKANSTDPESQIFQGGVSVINIGRNTFSPRETTIKRTQLADTGTYILANHTFKGGFDYSKDNILNYFPGNFFGSYRFISVADYANANPVSFTQAFPGPGTTGPITHPNLKELGLFVQDEWRISPVTVNAGRRYDKQTMAQPSVLNPDAQLQAAGYFTNKIPVDNNNLGPRLGIAWDARNDGRTVVRAGYGVFYGRTPSIMIGTRLSDNLLPLRTITFTGALIPTYPNIYSALPTGVTLPKPTIFVFSPNFQNPKVDQANFGVEQQLGSDYSVGMNYQYVKGSDLPRSRDINETNPTTVTTPICRGSSAAAFADPITGPALITGTATYTRYTGRPVPP